MPSKWRSIPFELRATSEWVEAISSALVAATAAGAPQNILDLLKNIKDEVVAANSAMRGRTKPVPLDDVTIDRDPAMDDKGNLIAYTTSPTTAWITDTLGTQELTWTTGYNWAYPDINGSPTNTVTASVSNHTVQSNFGCTGITEQTPISYPFLDSLTYRVIGV